MTLSTDDTPVGVHLGVGPGPLVIVLLMPMVLGPLSGIGLVIVNAQVRVLMEVARSIHVDLLQLDGYTAIAAPFMRYLMIVLFTFSGLGPALLIGSPELTRGAWMVMGVFLTLFVPVRCAYFLPVLVLRNRIRDEKRTLLKGLRAARLGEAPPPELSISEVPGVPQPDLLTQQLFVESRWEWPVATHIQKLALVGMLPPLSWPAAALMEQLLFD
jgi:hypothetical protein